MYQVIKNGTVVREYKFFNDAIDFALALCEEGFTGRIAVECNSKVVFEERN